MKSLSPALLEEYKKIGAFWVHDDNPKRPHALLTSGKHSNGFFNGSKVIVDPQLLRRSLLSILWCDEGPKHLSHRPKYVVGSALGAINIAHTMAEILGTKSCFTEPNVIDGVKHMELKRFSISPKSDVLVVEDVLTTGGTTLKTIKALEDKGVFVLPSILVLVNRSGMVRLGDRKIFSLIDHHMPIWEPDECPLCKAGSEAVRPKDNWDRLTADYDVD